jgi:hypothetical protein
MPILPIRSFPLGESLMHGRRALQYFAVVLFAVTSGQAVPFVVFPKAEQLASADGRFVVRNTDREAPLTELVGTFHFLFLEDTASGYSRKLCDYVGVAAVAWTDKNSIIVTQYVGKRTSRALIFAADNTDDPVVIDQPLLTHLISYDLLPHLQGNDHVFVEATKVDGETLTLRVWGYGQHDAHGFRLNCEYNLQEGSATCREGNRP